MKRFILYTLVGIGTVFIDVGTMSILFYRLHYSSTLSVGSGLILSMLFQFFFNFFFTFELGKSDGIRVSLLLYIIFTLIGNLLALGIIELLYYLLGNLLVAKLLSLLFSFAYGYSVSTFVIFNRKVIDWIRHRRWHEKRFIR